MSWYNPISWFREKPKQVIDFSPLYSMQRQVAGQEVEIEGLKSDLKLAMSREDPPSNTVEQSIKWKRRITPKGLFYETPSSSPFRTIQTEGTPPPHDLSEVLRLLDIESYFNLSVDRHVGLIMKRGYKIAGRNPETVAYVTRRLTHFDYTSRLPVKELIRQCVRNVVATSNGFIATVRDPDRSAGRKVRLFGKELDPIAALDVIDPASMRVRQTSTGLIQGWTQVVGADKKQFPHYNMIHVAINVKSGYVFGVPFVIPALQDIQALRKLELIAEHVAHKYAFPLMHWKVGNEKLTAGLVTDAATGMQVPEVELADRYAQLLAQEGYVATSERHEISMIGVEGDLVDIDKYIEHYELRVLAGLRLSMLDLGRGDTANRGTAQVLSRILVDECLAIQDVVACSLKRHLLDMLVMEGGFDLNEENEVTLFWPPIDAEESRAQETHGLNLYLSGGISRAEFRNDYLGRDDLTPEEEQNTFLNEHLIPLAKATAAAKAANAATPSKSTANLAQPTNQYGKLATKPSLPSNDEIMARVVLPDIVTDDKILEDNE